MSIIDSAILASATPLVIAALAEDLDVSGDLSSQLLVPRHRIRAEVRTRKPGVICGSVLIDLIVQRYQERNLELARAVPILSERLIGKSHVFDGDRVGAGQAVMLLSGYSRDVLAVERTVLNFLSRLSGVATITAAFVAAARAVSPAVKICDTRKTTPGWRILEKYAVRCGGGTNHRMGLHDAIIIKDNHISGVPDVQLGAHVAQLLRRIETLPAKPQFVCLEVDRLEQFAAVCQTPGIDIVMLDNFTLEQLREAVVMRDAQDLRGRLLLEASGGVTLANVAEIAATGVDRISVGALTHSAPALDIGLDIIMM